MASSVDGKTTSEGETKLSESTKNQDPAISVDAAADNSSFQGAASQPEDPPQSQSTTPYPPQNTAPYPPNEHSPPNTAPHPIETQPPHATPYPPNPTEGPPQNTSPYPPQSSAIPHAENNPAYPPPSYSATPSSTNYGYQHDQQHIPPAQPSPQVALRSNQPQVGITVIHVRNVERQIQRNSMLRLEEMYTPPPTHMRLAVISTFFCFCNGLFAMYFASQVEPFWNQGRHDKARLASYRAKRNAYSGIFAGIVIIFLVIFVLVSI